MKKKLLTLLSVICICTLCAGCSDGSTTMDEGKDTDGKAGETPQATSTMKPGTSGENGEGAQESADNMIDDGKNAAEDLVDGAGNAAKDIVDGAGNAAKSAADGVNRAVDNMR